MAKRADPPLKGSDAGENGNGEKTALLAYFYWQARGCPEGSPEEDWFRAVQELRPVAGPSRTP